MNDFRPKTLNDIIGNEQIVNRIKISVDAAKEHGGVMPHALLSGPPGLGKTTLANAMANDLNVDITILNGGNIKSPKDVIPHLMKIKHGQIIFIDEVHRIPIKVEEFMYPVMEDYRMDIGGDSLSVDVEPFTLIGATTLAGSLSRPFLDRFVYKYVLDLYSSDELTEILKANTTKVGLTFEESALKSLAVRSRGTPRIANNNLLWMRDYCTSIRIRRVDTSTLDRGMAMIGIDRQGLNTLDRKYLEILKNCDKPLGLNTLSSILNVDKDTLQSTVEPYLLRLKLIEKTPLGRKCHGLQKDDKS